MRIYTLKMLTQFPSMNMKNWLSLGLLALVALHQRLPTSFADRYIGKDYIVFIVLGKDCYVSRAAAVAGSR